MCFLRGFIDDEMAANDEGPHFLNMKSVFDGLTIFAEYDGVGEFENGPVVRRLILGNRSHNGTLLPPSGIGFGFGFHARRGRSSPAASHSDGFGSWRECTMGARVSRKIACIDGRDETAR